MALKYHRYLKRPKCDICKVLGGKKLRHPREYLPGFDSLHPLQVSLSITYNVFVPLSGLVTTFFTTSSFLFYTVQGGSRLSRIYKFYPTRLSVTNEPMRLLAPQERRLTIFSCLLLLLFSIWLLPMPQSLLDQQHSSFSAFLAQILEEFRQSQKVCLVVFQAIGFFPYMNRSKS